MNSVPQLTSLAMLQCAAVSVKLSCVRQSVPAISRVAGLLLWAGRACDIDQLLHGMPAAGMAAFRSISTAAVRTVCVYATVLDLTGGDVVHKPSSSVVDMTSPLPSAFHLLAAESSSTPAALPPAFHTDLPVSDGLATCMNAQRSFQWPGIDAIMESYQLYLEGVCH